MIIWVLYWLGLFLTFTVVVEIAFRTKKKPELIVSKEQETLKLSEIEIYYTKDYIKDFTAYRSVIFYQTTALKLCSILNNNFRKNFREGYFVYKDPLFVRNHLVLQSTLFIGVI